MKYQFKIMPNYKKQKDPIAFMIDDLVEIYEMPRVKKFNNVKIQEHGSEHYLVSGSAQRSYRDGVWFKRDLIGIVTKIEE